MNNSAVSHSGHAHVSLQDIAASVSRDKIFHCMPGVVILRTSPKNHSPVCGVAAERRGTVAEYAGIAADRAGNVAEHTSVFGEVAYERDGSGRRKCDTTR